MEIGRIEDQTPTEPATPGKPIIHFEIKEDCRGRFLHKAYLDKGSKPMEPLNLELASKTKSFRAICILLLIAKYVGDKACESPFSVDTARSTWLYTLGTFFRTNRDNWFKKNLKTACLFHGSRGTTESGGDLRPYVNYWPQILSTNNLKFYSKAPNSDSDKAEPLTHEQLREYASRLEKNSRWTAPTIEVLLPEKTTDKQDKKRHQQEIGVAVKPDERRTFLLDVREIINLIVARSKWFYNIKRTLRIYPGLCNFPLTNYGDTVLHLAVRYGHTKTINHLLKLEGVNIDCKNKSGVTPLLQAARLNDLSLTKRLLKRGADPNAKNNQGANAIYEAAFGASLDALEVIKYFYKLGVNPNVVCLDGTTTLSTAIQRLNSEETLRFLTIQSRNAASNAPNDSTLSSTVELEKAAFLKKEVKKFIELAARLDVKIANPAGLPTPPTWGTKEVFAAALNGDLHRLEFVINNPETDVDFEDLVFGTTAFHMATENLDWDIMFRLLAANANPLVQDRHGRTPREVLPVRVGTDRSRSFEESKKSKHLRAWEEDMIIVERDWVNQNSETLEVNLLF